MRTRRFFGARPASAGVPGGSLSNFQSRTSSSIGKGTNFFASHRTAEFNSLRFMDGRLMIELKTVKLGRAATTFVEVVRASRRMVFKALTTARRLDSASFLTTSFVCSEYP